MLQKIVLCVTDLTIHEYYIFDYPRCVKFQKIGLVDPLCFYHTVGRKGGSEKTDIITLEFRAAEFQQLEAIREYILFHRGEICDKGGFVTEKHAGVLRIMLDSFYKICFFLKK